jgi:RNA polymerase sigma-70 factor (ECF subfamily)
MVLELACQGFFAKETHVSRIFRVISSFANVLYNKISQNTAESETAEVSEESEVKAKAAGDVSLRASEILDKYGNSVLRVAYTYLHNMSDAEDILQDTLIQFLKSAPSFENEGHEKAWLLTVASNLSKNKLTYLKIRQTDELSEELVSEEKEDLKYVWEAVKKLPVKNREVIHLFYQEGYSTKEIADILKRREATVRSDLKRGREKLKKILKEAYDFE